MTFLELRWKDRRLGKKTNHTITKNFSSCPCNWKERKEYSIEGSNKERKKRRKLGGGKEGEAKKKESKRTKPKKKKKIHKRSARLYLTREKKLTKPLM